MKRMESIVLRQVFPEPREFVLTRPMEPIAIRVEDQVKRIPAENEVATWPQEFAVTPDGTRLLIGWQFSVRLPGAQTQVHTDRLELWDIPGRKRLAIWRDPGTLGVGSWNDLRFRPNGQALLARVQGGRVALWDAATGNERHASFEIMEDRGPGKAVIHSLHRAEWFPGGAQIFGEMNDRSLAVYDAATAKLVRRWPGPDSELTAAVVAPSGRLAATAHKDRVLRLWNLDDGRELARWEAHDTAIGAVAFSSDGRALVSGDADGTLKLWDLTALRRDLAALGLDWE